MKTISKRTGALVAVGAYAVSVFAGLGFAFNVKASADENANEGLTYFYNNLRHNPRAQRVYEAFEALDESGSFKTGKVEYDATENKVFEGEDVRKYVEEGNTKVPVAFGAGATLILWITPIYSIGTFSRFL